LAAHPHGVIQPFVSPATTNDRSRGERPHPATMAKAQLRKKGMQ